MLSVERVILQVSDVKGVEPYLALATATAESNLDPHAKGDYVNGQPTSFGLYQLHRGGELGNLTPEQAYDPRTNAEVALTEIARVAHLHPHWSPGTIAAAAQRPLHQAAYAARVDRIYHDMVGPGHTRLFRFLGLARPGKRWMRGEDVRALQARFGIARDGVFGPDTLAHTQSFQDDAGIADDGIVGPITSRHLGWTWAG